MIKFILAMFATLMALISTSAHAVLPTGVDTAISGAQGDATSVGGYVLIAIAGIFMFTLVRKVLK